MNDVKRVVLHEPADCEPLLAEHMPYRPDSNGAIIVADFRLQPIAVLPAESVTQVENALTWPMVGQSINEKSFAKRFEVFHGRDVFLVRTGYHGPLDLFSRILEHAGANVRFVHSIHPERAETLFAHLPTRDELLAADAGVFDRAQEKAEKATAARKGLN